MDTAKKARYLILIDTGDGNVARLLDAERRQLAEIDAGAEEVAVMTQGLQPAHTATGHEWDDALRGHNRPQRMAAQVYTLDV
jgi:hypothetical protein